MRTSIGLGFLSVGTDETAPCATLGLMEGVEGTLARLLYGTGMRLAEGLNLRVKDVDFDRHVVIVRSDKGDKDRGVMLPLSLVQLLKTQLAKSRNFWAGLPTSFLRHHFKDWWA